MVSPLTPPASGGFSAFSASLNLLTLTQLSANLYLKSLKLLPAHFGLAVLENVVGLIGFVFGEVALSEQVTVVLAVLLGDEALGEECGV